MYYVDILGEATYFFSEQKNSSGLPGFQGSLMWAICSFFSCSGMTYFKVYSNKAKVKCRQYKQSIYFITTFVLLPQEFPGVA